MLHAATLMLVFLSFKVFDQFDQMFFNAIGGDDTINVFILKFKKPLPMMSFPYVKIIILQIARRNNGLKDLLKRIRTAAKSRKYNMPYVGAGFTFFSRTCDPI